MPFIVLEETLMPGRARRRGSSQSSVPSTPQSSIRRRTSVHTSRAAFTSLRRSARLLELLTANERRLPDPEPQGPPNTTNGMDMPSLNPVSFSGQSSSSRRAEEIADPATAGNLVATQTGTLIASNDQDGTARRSDIREAGRSGTQHIMDILVEPPSHTRPGLLLNPPLVLRLKRGLDRDGEQPLPVDPALFWAVVSVLPADSDTPLPVPHADILTGTPVDSVHPLNPDVTGREIGYMSFTDLTIRKPGRYRLRICLIQMNAVGQSDVPPFEGGLSVKNMSSKVITVDHDVEPTMIGNEDREILESLRHRGLRVDNQPDE